MEETIVLRPRLAVALGAVGVVAAAVALVVLAFELPPARWLRFVPAIALVGALGVVLFSRPSLTVAPEAVVVRNPFETVVVPWSALRGVETRRALVLETAEGPVSVWVGATGPTEPWAELIRARLGEAASDSPAPLIHRRHTATIVVLILLAAASVVGALV